MAPSLHLACLYVCEWA